MYCSQFFTFLPLKFQVENLQKSLQDTSGSSPTSIKSRVQQVKELEDEVSIVLY